MIGDPTRGMILAIDQGTSSTKALVLDATGRIVSQGSAPVGQTHPRPGWVEQDARDILDSVFLAVAQATAGVGDRIAAIGISSQRESAVVWERSTGAPLGPVLGWQDRRTASAAQTLRDAGAADLVRSASGLPIDPMFSALKFAYLLDEIDPDRTRAASGAIALGTVDSWLMFCLTGEHRIEAGNASRTQLLALASVEWDDELLGLFRIPRQALPDVVASNSPSALVTSLPGVPKGVRVCGVLGDSHAALYGHGVRAPGPVKATYGTGSSIMGLKTEPGPSAAGLVSTIAWDIDGAVYAFEGNILSSGSTLVWLAAILGTDAASLVALAESASGESTVDLVPAFAGLGAPWWDDAAEALVVGLTLGTDRAALARAAVESIPLQIEDILAAAEAETGARIDTIHADGGPSANPWLMQLQADLSQRQVVASEVAELSAVGAGLLAGTVAGLWSDETARSVAASGRRSMPNLPPDAARERRSRWLAAVARSRSTAGTSLAAPIPLTK